VFAVTQVALLVVIELCVVLGLSLAAIRWHRQSAPQRGLPVDSDHQRDVVADYEATIDTYRDVPTRARGTKSRVESER
jgi:hypothetical protein